MTPEEEVVKLIREYMSGISPQSYGRVTNVVSMANDLIDSHKRMREDNQAVGKRWRELPLWRKFLESPSTGWAIFKWDLHSKRIKLGFYIGSLVAGEDITHNC
jgi:hypothetical protein